VLELSGIFPCVRTTEQLNKLFICTFLSKIVKTFQFYLKLDDCKAESTYVALHTSAITYSYLLDQKISQTIVEKVKLMFYVQYTSSITLRVFHMFGLINNAVSDLDYMA
jgi:hypothetical protein